MDYKYSHVLVDDNDIDRIVLATYLKKYTFLGEGLSFSSPKACLEYFERNRVDLLFLDVEMPYMNGVELLELVKDKIKCAVFITSHPDFAIDGFRLCAVDYLLKPITKERLDTCLVRVHSLLDDQRKAQLYEKGFSTKKITLKSGNSQVVSVDAMSIVYLEALKDYTKVVLQNDENVVIYGNLSTTLRNEHFAHFVRVHKSYAVALSNIHKINTKDLTLNTNHSVPVGKEYRKQLLTMISLPESV